jgi:hypothetical protein
MPKNCILFLLFQIFVVFITKAQRKPDIPDSLKSLIVQPAFTSASVESIPIHEIIITDNRFDTSKIGYVKKGRSYKKLITEKSLAATLQQSLNKKYGLPANNFATTLLIVIKKYWLEEASLAEQKDYKMAKASETTVEQATCVFGFDVYLVREKSYIPVFKLDTLFVQKCMLKKCVAELMVQPFDFCINKIAHINLSRIGQAKVKLSWAEIEQYNAQRLTFPRFSAATHEKGIYRTFDDFLQNKPVRQEFTVQYGAQTDEIFIIEDGKPVLLTEFWGLCDGQKNYIKLGFNIFELIRHHNTYELWGSKTTVDYSARYPASNNTPATAILGSALVNNNQVELNHKPLQLDMETGKVY